MPSLNALSGALQSDRERYLAAAAREFQATTGSSARHNALELLLIHIAAALGASEAMELERWAQREARNVPAAEIADYLRAVSFAILASIESQRELFEVVLLRLDYLEKRVNETVRRYARRERTFPEASARSGACEAILAIAASLDPASVSRRRAAARLAETLASDLAFSPEAVRDIRDAALLAVLHDIDRFGVRMCPADVAAIAPLAPLASFFTIDADLDARADLEGLWERQPSALILIVAADATSWPNDGLAAYLESERSLGLPPTVRNAVERASGAVPLRFDREPHEVPVTAGRFSARF